MRRCSPLLLLLLLPSPAAATNTADEVELQVVLHDGEAVEGRLTWKKDKLYVKGRRTAKVRYNDISSIGLVPPEPLEVRLRPYERRLKQVVDADAESWARLAHWAAREGLSEQAAAAYAKVLELAPDHEEARHAVGQLRDEDGSWVEGRQVLLRMQRELAPGDHDATVALARWALERDQRDFAFDLLCEVLRADIYHRDGLRLLKPFTDAYQHQNQPLLLPVRGRWRASTDPTRHHQAKSYAVYALDINKVDAQGNLCRGRGRKLEDHYAWGAPFYAVAAGTVFKVTNDQPDNPIGDIGGRYEQHNGVSIRHDNGELSWYVHAKKGSIVVKVGDQVEAGQLLGEVGNSGGSAIPHLHFTLVAWQAISVPWTCDNFRVVAPDGTPIRVTRAWPREGWTFEMPEEGE